MTDTLDLESLRIEGRRSTGVWGGAAGAGVLAIVLAYFLYAYLYLSVSSDVWPPTPIPEPPLLRPALLLGLLAVGGAVAVWAGWRQADDPRAVALAHTVVVVIGAAAVVLGGLLIGDLALRPRSHAYGASVHTVHALQGAATLAGIGMSGLTAFEAHRLGRHPWVGAATVVCSIWWSTLVLGWIAVFAVVYVWPQAA